MLTALIEQQGKRRTEHIFVIDSHSHLGEDVDGAKMMNPLAPGGTFDFWGNVQGKVRAYWEESGEKTFSTYIDNLSTKISWSFTPYPFTTKMYAALETYGKKYSDLKEKSKFYTFIDQGVVFPFQDIFRDKHPEALYRASNTNISRFSTRFPFSMKLIGYCRVDPSEGEKAVNEVKYAREVLGLRGLKLHPRSERWVDDVVSDKAIPILMEAAKRSMPIIFDTRGRGSILDIGKLIEMTRNIIKSKFPDLLPHFKVIIAHFAQGNVGDHKVYDAIVQPNTYGDLSMLHGEGASNFFKDFRKWFKLNNKYIVDNRDWSEYLLFASDFPYFGDVHAEKLLIHIINKEFFDSGGTIKDTRNILGLNQVRILPEYNLPQNHKPIRKLPSTIVSNPNFKTNEIDAFDVSVDALANLIVNNKIDIKNVCLQFNGGWNELSENVLLTIEKTSNKENLTILLLNLVKNYVSLIAPLETDKLWKKFGYKYDSSHDRGFFASIFKQNYLTFDKNQAVESLLSVFE